MAIELLIRGQPIPAGREAKVVGRHRCSSAGAKCGRRALLAWRATYSAWKDAARPQVERWLTRQPTVFRREAPFSGLGISVDVLCVFKRPASRPVLTVAKRRVPYPYPWDGSRVPMLGTVDWENLAKGPCDVLVEAGVLQDDRWISQGRCTKLYAAEGEGPHVVVTLRPIEVGAHHQEDMWKR